MKPTAMVVPTVNGPAAVLVWHREGGLAVTESANRNGTFAVTHIDSGRAAHPNLPSIDAAMGALRDFLGVGDWTRSEEALTADAEFWRRAGNVRAILTQRFPVGPSVTGDDE